MGGVVEVDFGRMVGVMDNFEWSIWDAFFINSLNFIFFLGGAVGVVDDEAGFLPEAVGVTPLFPFVRGSFLRVCGCAGAFLMGIFATNFFDGWPILSRFACSFFSISSFLAAFNRATTGSTTLCP